MCVLIFGTNLSKTFLILKRTERDMMLNIIVTLRKMNTGLHVKYRYSCQMLL